MAYHDVPQVATLQLRRDVQGCGDASGNRSVVAGGSRHRQTRHSLEVLGRDTPILMTANID
jgi:hypothetical protein